MPTSFGNYTPAEYEALEREKRRVEDDLRVLQEAVGRQESTDRVAEMARASIERVSRQGGEIDILVEATLASEVSEPIIQDKTETIVAHLREQHREAAEAEVNDPEWVKRVRDEYDEMFRADGTYRKIETEAQSKQRAEIRDSLLATRRSQIDAELVTDEAIKVATDQVKRDIKPELDDYRARRQKELPGELREEAIAEAKEEIDAELRKEGESTQGHRVETWISSDAGKKYRQQRTREIEKELNDQAETTGRARIEGEILRDIEVFDKYLSDFEGDGIDLTAIPEGTPLTLAMGEIVQKKNPKYSSYSYSHQQAPPEYIHALGDEKRVMMLVSEGEGLFYVKQDSLDQEKHTYLRGLSLTGKVISVGRFVSNKSHSRDGIESKLALGEVPFFDDDTTDPEDIINSRLPLVNVAVAGVPAVKQFADVLK